MLNVPVLSKVEFYFALVVVLKKGFPLVGANKSTLGVTKVRGMRNQSTGV